MRSGKLCTDVLIVAGLSTIEYASSRLKIEDTTMMMKLINQKLLSSREEIIQLIILSFMEECTKSFADSYCDFRDFPPISLEILRSHSSRLTLIISSLSLEMELISLGMLYANELHKKFFPFFFSSIFLSHFHYDFCLPTRVASCRFVLNFFIEGKANESMK